MKLWNGNPEWPWPHDDDISKYVDVPEWWLVGYEEVRGFLRGLTKAQFLSAGKSAGGRDLTVAYYGPAKPERKLCIAGGTHGTEVEGVASVTNIIKLFESGADLRGEKWPAFQRVAKRVGFYLMPFYNPDAAARSPVKSYVGMPIDLKDPSDGVHHLHIGFWKNGRLPNRKRIFGPWSKGSDMAGKLDRVGYLGQRFNDAGRLINRPRSRRKSMAVETMQMLKYLEANEIDCYMDLHSFSSSPWLGTCPEAHHAGDYEQQVKLFELACKMTKQAGGPELVQGWEASTAWYNRHFFSANLGIYGFGYEAKAGFKGNYPDDKPWEEIWLANAYNGMYTILGLAQALLKVPSPWK